MHSLKKFRASLIDIIKTPQAPKMGKIPLPEIADDDKHYAPSIASDGTSSETDTPHILAPTPRKPHKSLSSLSRTTMDAPAARTPALKQRSKYASQPSSAATPSPGLKRTSRPTPAPEKTNPSMPHAQKPPRSPHDEKERPSRERRGSRSSQDTQTRATVYRPAEGHKSLEMPGYTEPVIPSKDARPAKGILKPPPVRRPSEVSLHWQLLPHALAKKQLYFDIIHTPSLIRDHTDPSFPKKHGEREMEKPAANVSFTNMLIRINCLQHWPISPFNPGGLSCRDVFDAIHDTLRVPLTEAERERLLPPGSEELRDAERACARRCKTSPGGISGRLRKDGILRVDLLGKRTIFMGLKQDPEDRYWVLELGMPKPGSGWT